MTPDEWDGSEWVPLDVLARRHDHKGHSEEMCIRCGWTMGQIPLNCQNNDTPHVFPSQQAEIERLRQRGDNLHTVAVEMPNPRHNLSWLAWRTQMDNALMGWEETRRG
jgi:hypothetical protein